MSLQVNDPRSRGRSKSPSGRIRERSRSRDNRLPPVSSPAVEATRQATRSYLNPNHADDPRRERSRSRGATSRHTSSRYDSLSESDDDSEHEVKGKNSYLRSVDTRTDRYYLSDSGDTKPARRQRTTADARSPNLRPVQHHNYSDDSLSDDDALAYGDLPDDLERGYYGYTSPRTSSSRVDGVQQVSAGYNNGGAAFKQGASAVRPEPVGSHPSYARPDSYQYATPGNLLHNQHPSYSGPPPTSAAPQGTWAPIPDCERPGYIPPSSQAEAQAMPGAFPTAAPGLPERAGVSGPGFTMPQYVTADGNPYTTWGDRSVPTSNAYAPPVSMAPHTHQRTVSSDSTSQLAYANPSPYQYAQVDPKVKYGSKTSASKPFSYSATPTYSRGGESHGKYSDVKYTTAPQFVAKTSTTRPQDLGQQFVEITPGGRMGPRPTSLSVSSAHNQLGVEAPDPSFRPVSPMLEPYKGTYQSISPMPSPIVVPSSMDDGLSDLEPLDGVSDAEAERKHRRKKSKDEKDRKERKSDRAKRDTSRVRHERFPSSSQVAGAAESLMLISPSSARKKVSFYDAAADATAMQEALSHSRTVDNKALVRVLPHLTSDEMLNLRKEYKNHVKLRGKGINLAKHLRVKLGTNAFGKVCYATALGRWESEAFWANCYYQSSTSRRELLIESLFGRPNEEVQAIKECFRDSRYADSLEKCMKAELKADKFRTAVLMALEASRQSEREPIDPELVQRDVQDLHHALISRHGGETAMICIIVRRSDAHLREVLRTYEKVHNRNFARAMIAKSQNLVGETLAHILNGVINRPMRDALLLHQALRESQSGKERSELLISRLVRFHWEPLHLEQVKREFRRRYGERLEEAIAVEVLPTSGGTEWGEFCIELARSSKTLAGKA
ncbi:hypothetical protein FE257_006887 [Aspergillus nanangensis]|uniref:Annexin ANXC4 n=1 Tax=Aspergillus nanangensis TaxID=2582783 RepID=A0AAD4GUJ1_ASPNN|nr:hypothetical protein FE257_006887 [Aspergillus nanangensis]